MNKESISLKNFIAAGISADSITRTLKGMPDTTVTDTEVTTSTDMYEDVRFALAALIEDSYQSRQRRIENPQYS